MIRTPRNSLSKELAAFPHSKPIDERRMTLVVFTFFVKIKRTRKTYQLSSLHKEYFHIIKVIKQLLIWNMYLPDLPSRNTIDLYRLQLDEYNVIHVLFSLVINGDDTGAF